MHKDIKFAMEKGKISAKKGEQVTMLKYSGAVPCVEKHTDKVIKAFKKLYANVGISNNAAMVKSISNDLTEKREKVDQSRLYKIIYGQCDSVYIGESGRKFSTRMNEHTKSKAKWDDESQFEKHCNDEGEIRNTPHRDFHQEEET